MEDEDDDSEGPGHLIMPVHFLDLQVTSDVSSELPLVALLTLASAIRCMSNLTRFRWLTHVISPNNEPFTALRDSFPRPDHVEILDNDVLFDHRFLDIENSPMRSCS